MEELISTKKVLYVDMDNVLVDFPSGIARLSTEDRQTYEADLDEAPGIFALMDPIDGAIDAYKKLAQVFDTYILSTAPWKNPSAWSDKLMWGAEALRSRERHARVETRHPFPSQALEPGSDHHR